MCVCVCVLGEGVVTVGDKGLSAAREPTRGRMASGMEYKCQDSMKSRWDFSAVVWS